MSAADLPAKFVERMDRLAEALGVDDLLPRLLLRPDPAFRLRHGPMPAALAALGPRPIPGVVHGWSLDRTHRELLTHDPATGAGLVYPQSASSQWTGHAVPLPADGEGRSPRVLDLAAAPGGKTILLADRLAAAGFEPAACLTAVEAVPARFHRLRANLERCGHRDLAASGVRCHDGRRLPREFADAFDAVLLDAPCSSEARIDPDKPESFARWSLGKVRDMARKQWGLLGAALRALAPGGECIYSTCSLAPEENEATVAAWLTASERGAGPRCELRPLDGLGTLPDSVPGLRRWGRKDWPEALSACRRILPGPVFDGFFVARIARLA